MKKMTLNFVGDVSIASYDTYLDGKSLTSIIAKSVLDEDTKELADEFFQLTLADRGVNLPETERKQ